MLEYREFHKRGSGLFLRLKGVLYTHQSPYQRIEVLDTEDFGRMLALDGLVMTTEADEFYYHEMLVHPGAVLAPQLQQVLIIGGGDGGTLREAAKYPEPQRLVMVELDEAVVRVAQRYLPSLARAFDDPRLDLRFMDGAQYLESTEETFDLILVDSPDPIGPAEVLFSESFYARVRDRLRPQGILVAQTESPVYHRDLIEATARRLRALFPTVLFYTAPVPTYPSGFWSFALATHLPRQELRPRRPAPEGLKWFHTGMIPAVFDAVPAFMKQP